MTNMHQESTLLQATKELSGPEKAACVATHDPNSIMLSPSTAFKNSFLLDLSSKSFVYKNSGSQNQSRHATLRIAS